MRKLSLFNWWCEEDWSVSWALRETHFVLTEARETEKCLTVGFDELSVWLWVKHKQMYVFYKPSWLLPSFYLPCMSYFSFCSLSLHYLAWSPPPRCELYSPHCSPHTLRHCVHCVVIQWMWLSVRNLRHYILCSKRRLWCDTQTSLGKCRG